MGGRGSGSTILKVQIGGVIITDRGDVSWRNIVADFNPNAGHREVDYSQTMMDFATASKKVGATKNEYLGIVDDQGYVTKVTQGEDGHCYYTDDMRADMVGHDITHYHNRYEATQQQIDETNESINEWKGVAKAYNRHLKANQRRKDAEKRFNDASNTIKRYGGDPNSPNPPANLKTFYDEREKAWHEYELANRQRTRAEKDFRDRYKSYTGEDAPSRTSQFSIPDCRNVTIDETGYIGGPFSAADIDSSLVAKDIPSFSASCDEGVYTISLQKDCTDDDLFKARSRIRRLFDTNHPTKEANAFQRRIRGIDRRTAEDGKKAGWSDQQIRATSMNRQMAYLWQMECKIFGENHISATFDANPNFKPKWDF